MGNDQRTADSASENLRHRATQIEMIGRLIKQQIGLANKAAANAARMRQPPENDDRTIQVFLCIQGPSTGHGPAILDAVALSSCRPNHSFSDRLWYFAELCNGLSFRITFNHKFNRRLTSRGHFLRDLADT